MAKRGAIIPGGGEGQEEKKRFSKKYPPPDIHNEDWSKRNILLYVSKAFKAQLGERQTEDLMVPGSSPGGSYFYLFLANLTL